MRRLARISLLEFIAYVWWKPTPLVIGRHTKAICDAISDAIDKYLQGESSFLDIACPFRHGKSDIVSRALPAFFLGRCKRLDPDIIMSGYGASLVEGFSRDTKNIIKSARYMELFPDVEIKPKNDRADEWRIKGSTGVVSVAGLGGALTGKGGSLIVLDDYCKSRAEAVSEAYRKKTFEAFQNDLMTRRAPVSIVIVCATPWHIDDVRGRIRKMENNDDFPKFTQLRFPARDENGGFLFPERFNDDWYKQQYATLGKLSAGLLDCSPTLEGGNRFNVDMVAQDDISRFPSTRYVRAWDLASSEKERDKDDPDFTVGVLAAVTKDNGISHLWIKDCAYTQAEAPRRNAMIMQKAVGDGSSVIQYVEAFGGYKDTYTTLRSLLQGVAVVRKAQLQGDKSEKLAPLEILFEEGRVHVPKNAPWLNMLFKHFREFPDGEHDDFCDAAAIAYHACTKSGFGII